jgi:hypothetical protein
MHEHLISEFGNVFGSPMVVAEARGADSSLCIQTKGKQ